MVTPVNREFAREETSEKLPPLNLTIRPEQRVDRKRPCEAGVAVRVPARLPDKK